MLKVTPMIVLLFILAACTSPQGSKEDIKKVLMENPQIIVDAIEKNPQKILDALQKAAGGMKKRMAKKREEEEKKKLEQAYDKPLVPEIRADESFRGNPNAPITLVEYSDFQCPYCSRALDTVLSLLKKYEGKIRFVYKHLPLDFHDQAQTASKYYEAIRLQNAEKAFKFHDLVYKNQPKLRNGKKFLDSLAKKVGANMSRLNSDIKSKKIAERIEQDLAEARKYGFQGTPGFILNGVPIKGALPLSHFEKIIEELKKRGKISI